MLDPWLLQNNKNTSELSSDTVRELEEVEVAVEKNQKIFQDFEDNFIDLLKEKKENELKLLENKIKTIEIVEFNQTTDNGQNIEEKTTEGLKDFVAYQPLDDTQLYIQTLERKLNKLKKSPKLLEALSEKRADCLRSFLLDDSSTVNQSLTIFQTNRNHEDFQLNEQCTADSDTVAQNLYRHLQPKQAVTFGERVHLIKHDHLAQLHDSQ